MGGVLVGAGKERVHVRGVPGNDALDVSIAADSLRIVSPLRAAFGDRIKTLSLSATLSPGRSFARLRAGASAWTDALRNFQRVDGSVHVDGFEIAFNAFSADGHGAFGFDSDLRPRGLLDISIAHFNKFLATNRKGSSGLAPALALHRGGSDEEGRVNVVFTCSGGISYLGDQPIGTLGTLF